MGERLLPLHLSVAGRPVVVIGGGPVAWRKAGAALDSGADVTVVAPYLCEEFAAAAAAGEVAWQQRDYLPGDITGAWLAFAATGDTATDEAVEREAASHQMFCVRASARPVGDGGNARVDGANAGVNGVNAGAYGGRGGVHSGTRSPAVLHRGSVTIGVSTSDGADPRRAVAIRDAIGWALDSGQLPLRRRRGGTGRVTLVGGGPGPGDLLTLRGRRALAEADVVVVDRLAPREVLDELGPGVLVVEVGKAPGHHVTSQTAINQLLIDHANAGSEVVRLKGGDPFVFGRGGEEVAACREAGVETSVVPGVSSAFAVPLAAGIPVTHRGVARQVTVITGHDRDGAVHADWPALARGTGTLVVLMGVAALPEISSALLAAGMVGGTPVAIVEDGGSPRQRVTVGTLDGITTEAQRRQVRAPAVVVIGAVAAFAGAGDTCASWPRASVMTRRSP